MSTRIPLLAGNWKLNGTASETIAILADLRKLVDGISGRDVVVAPPFTALPTAADALRGSSIALAAQNVHWADTGAYTGEISAPMLREAGCTYVIIGHSERRQYFGETDETVAQRLAAAIRHDLVPIVCVGETLEQRQTGQTLSIIERQLRGAVSDVPGTSFKQGVVAYEPVWAIGTGEVATPDQAQTVHASLRKILAACFGVAVAEKTRILYGGSVKPDNVDLLMQQPDVDGALVGGASLKAHDFARIVRFVESEAASS